MPNQKKIQLFHYIFWVGNIIRNSILSSSSSSREKKKKPFKLFFCVVTAQYVNQKLMQITQNENKDALLIVS